MKILIIRFSSIGDIVLTTPVIRCLKKQKNATIHYLTSSKFKCILDPNPYVDKVWAYQKKVSEVYATLQLEDYDYIIDLHHNLRSLKVKRKLGKTAFSFNKLNIEKWLLVNLKLNRLPNIHIVDRYMNTVSSLEVINDGQGLDYFIPIKDEVLPSSILGVSIPYIALVIGAAHTTKRLPINKLAEICNLTTQPILLLGGKDDTETGAKIITMVKNKNIYNTCGQYNLNQSASLIKQAQKVISHDTGLMHIAAAFQKTIISTWGNTTPAFGMYPYYGNRSDKNTSIQVNNLSCRPCSKIGYHKCPKKHFKCMNDIPLDKIQKALES